MLARYIRLLVLLLIPATPAMAEGLLPYSDPQAGFSISYPDNWEVIAAPLPKASLRMQEPDTSGGVSCLVYHERFEVFNDKTPQQALAAFSDEMVLRQFAGAMRNVKLISSMGTELSGRSARRVMFKFNAPGQDSSDVAPFLGDVMFTVENGGPYFLYCMAPANRFSFESAQFRSIQSSFTLLAPDQ